ncbi:hypothetical protein AVEN_67481-1 [Araneus ventricosus]|uniref:Retrotransposon gag domain-containing protein n=1 Tax=Araneus ventricosus TaxID=182803 RepID=A0A4Y2WL96_ARAVE|nr:hypothetical protein AVEN_67481-1 [Araneus ventricosus]
MADEKILKNPSLLASIRQFKGEDPEDFFKTLEATAPLGQWSPEQLKTIVVLRLEGRARRFYEASLIGQDLTYEQLKSKLLSQFKTEENFASNFSQFSMAVQLPSEKVRDFATRIEGLALNSFGEKAVGKDEMSTKLREKMVLSQFMAGLQPRIRAQMIVENPESFSAAMELGERIETAQSMLTPNVNVNVKESHSEKVLEAV